MSQNSLKALYNQNVFKYFCSRNKKKKDPICPWDSCGHLVSLVLTCNFSKILNHFYRCPKVHWKRWWINQKFVISFCFLTIKKKPARPFGHKGCLPCLCWMGCLDSGPNLADISDFFFFFFSSQENIKNIPIHRLFNEFRDT